MQTDPVGYGYAYCGNNPLGRVDPSGLEYVFLDLEDEDDPLTFAWIDESGNITKSWTFKNLAAWALWADNNKRLFPDSWKENQPGWKLSRKWINESQTPFSNDDFFWSLQALMFLDNDMIDVIEEIEEYMGKERNVKIRYNDRWRDKWGYGYNGYTYEGDTITLYWNPAWTQYGSSTGVDNPRHQWFDFPALVGLAHELSHADDFLTGGKRNMDTKSTELNAMRVENGVRLAFVNKVPGCAHILPRPGYGPDHTDITWDEYRSGNYPVYP